MSFSGADDRGLGQYTPKRLKEIWGEEKIFGANSIRNSGTVLSDA